MKIYVGGVINRGMQASLFHWTQIESPMIKILIVDGYPVIRHMLRMQLELMRDFRVIGEVENTREVVARVRQQKPDVVLVDMDRPGVDALSITRDLHSAIPDIPVVVLGMQYNMEVRQNLRAAGAADFLLKQANPVTLVEAIRRVVKNIGF
jgi:DNA-binding NarL/FixJ family response regulator